MESDTAVGGDCHCRAVYSTHCTGVETAFCPIGTQGNRIVDGIVLCRLRWLDRLKGEHFRSHKALGLRGEVVSCFFSNAAEEKCGGCLEGLNAHQPASQMAHHCS